MVDFFAAQDQLASLLKFVSVKSLAYSQNLLPIRSEYGRD
jgi:hypothetical protein